MRWSDLVTRDRQQVLNVFEEVFSHKTYTGRSGTMYGYEGLGSIYWHMVSKLLLAIQENVFAAIEQQAPKSLIGALADSYYLVRGGLSSDKTPGEYGAFPTDPYSHVRRLPIFVEIQAVSGITPKVHSAVSEPNQPINAPAWPSSPLKT